MRNLIISCVVMISLAGFTTSTFAAQVVTTKTTPTVKFNQPQPPVAKPVSQKLKGNGNSNGTINIPLESRSKSNLISNEKGVGKQKDGSSLNDVSTQQQMKMQMEMDEYENAQQMISNTEKKLKGTENEIIDNLK